jgi:hypothetical protein
VPKEHQLLKRKRLRTWTVEFVEFRYRESTAIHPMPQTSRGKIPAGFGSYGA